MDTFDNTYSLLLFSHSILSLRVLWTIIFVLFPVDRRWVRRSSFILNACSDFLIRLHAYTLLLPFNDFKPYPSIFTTYSTYAFLRPSCISPLRLLDPLPASLPLYVSIFSVVLPIQVFDFQIVRVPSCLRVHIIGSRPAAYLHGTSDPQRSERSAVMTHDGGKSGVASRSAT